MFVWHCRPTLSAGRYVGREFFYIWKLYIFRLVFHRNTGRYDIKESNLMQHKEQQKSNSIFIKKNIFSWILKSESYLLNLAIWHWMKSKDDWYIVSFTPHNVIVTVCVFVRHLFSFYPFYFDFHSARIIFDASSGFYLWNIKKTTAWHL